jgi:hypothetical protein
MRRFARLAGAQSLDRELAAYRPFHVKTARPRGRAAPDRNRGARFRRTAKTDQAIGRIVIGRIGLDMVLVNRTDERAP